MDDPSKTVGVVELRRLLFELKEHRPDIAFRYRLIGQMWAPNFLRLTDVSDKGILLKQEASDKLITIPNLSYIIQFELDQPFQSYQPYFHYDVVPSPEWQ